MRDVRWTYDDQRDVRIRTLEDQLAVARSAVLGLIPETIRSLLTSFYACDCRQDTYGWDYRVAEDVTAVASVLPRDQGSHFGERAYCPLCGHGSSSPYEFGFSLPEGLRRHLVGWGAPHNQCVVFATVSQWARDHWSGRFQESDARERAANAARIRERRRSEVLYRIDPLSEPVLGDDFLRHGCAARSDSQLAWAESRLSALGFRCTVDGRIKSFVDEQESHIVYADPRVEGEIQLLVYRLPLPKRRGGIGRTLSRRFRIADAWKHDLRSKYLARVSAALSELTVRSSKRAEPES